MPQVSLRVLSDRPVLSTFEKGVDGSRALSFGTSAGRHCAKDCAYHPANKRSSQRGRCYAIRNEKRFDRAQLHAKLKRHERTDPAVLVRKAIAELEVIYAGGNTVPWFRISTNGSVPMPRDCTPAFIKALRDLLDFCDEKNIPFHFPVESRRKWKFYKKIVGTRCILRWSATGRRSFVNSKIPCSMVAGTMEMTRPERITACKVMAKEHMETTGRKTIVCPAVADYFLNGTPHARSKAKCGNCVACALPGVDVVYPLH